MFNTENERLKEPWFENQSNSDAMSVNSTPTSPESERKKKGNNEKEKGCLSQNRYSMCGKGIIGIYAKDSKTRIITRGQTTYSTHIIYH